MISAPFSAADAASVLGTLAAIVFATGGIALKITGPNRYAKRAFMLGIALACMAGGAASIFA